MIRPCTDSDVPVIESIINQAAQAYEGVIPSDCFHHPYMTEHELLKEIAAGVQFWASEDEWMKGMAGKNFDIGVIWAGGAARAVKKHKLPINFVIPDEGAVAWFDTLTIAAGAPNPDGAAKFIDYMISPEFYVRWDTQSGAAVSAWCTLSGTCRCCVVPPACTSRMIW